MLNLVPRRDWTAFGVGGFLFFAPVIAGLAMVPFVRGASQSTLQTLIAILRPLFFFRLPGYLILHLNLQSDPYFLRLACVAIFYFMLGGLFAVAAQRAWRGDFLDAGQKVLAVFMVLVGAFVVSGLLTKALALG